MARVCEFVRRVQGEFYAIARRLRRGIGPLAVVVAIAAVLGTVGLFAMPRSFMQNDEGVKLIEAQSLLMNHWRSRALAYPGGEFDPNGVHFPLRPPFAWRHDGRWYGLYPTPFVAVSALTWWLFGFRGVFLLP